MDNIKVIVEDLSSIIYHERNIKLSQDEKDNVYEFLTKFEEPDLSNIETVVCDKIEGDNNNMLIIHSEDDFKLILLYNMHDSEYDIKKVRILKFKGGN